MKIQPASEWKDGIEGCFRGLPNATYRAASGINISALKKCRLSMKHYYHEVTNPEPDDPASHLVIGTLVHLAYLEPELLKDAYVVRPKEFADWRTNAAKAWRDAQSVPVVTIDEETQIKSTVAAIRDDELVGIMLDNAEIELSCFKIDKQTGLLLKGRADAVAVDSKGIKWIIDLKTIASGGTTQDAFSRQIAGRDYHLQAAFYSDLFKSDQFAFVVAEKVPPHDIAIDCLYESDIDLGRSAYRKLLDRVADCASSGSWPGNGGQIRLTTLPKWKINQEELL